MNTKNIGEKIREYRKKSNLSLEQFAELLELSSTHIGNIERGVKMPTLQTFIKILNTLNVSSDFILGNSLNSKTEIRLKEIFEELNEFEDIEKERILDLFSYIIKNSKDFNKNLK